MSIMISQTSLDFEKDEDVYPDGQSQKNESTLAQKKSIWEQETGNPDHCEAVWKSVSSVSREVPFTQAQSSSSGGIC